MTNEEIEKYKKRLVEIGNLSGGERCSGLRDIAIKLGVYYLSVEDIDTHTLYLNIHTHLQSEMMFNACISAKESGELAKQSCGSAKWSCFWAAIAAIAACISIVVMLCSK